jgi:hypothetical protein
MRGTVLYGTRDIRFEDTPEPKITKPTDATYRRILLPRWIVIEMESVVVAGSDPRDRYDNEITKSRVRST